MRYLLIVLFLSACASTKTIEVPIIKTKTVVYTPNARMYRCPAVDRPIYNKDQLVFQKNLLSTIVDLKTANDICRKSLSMIKKQAILAKKSLK